MRFYIPDHGESAEDAQPVPGQSPMRTHPKDAAQIAADWCHARRNGWEWNWPTVFVIIDGAGVEHRFRVERDMVPEFFASQAQ